MATRTVDNQNFMQTSGCQDQVHLNSYDPWKGINAYAGSSKSYAHFASGVNKVCKVMRDCFQVQNPGLKETISVSGKAAGFFTPMLIVQNVTDTISESNQAADGEHINLKTVAKLTRSVLDTAESIYSCIKWYGEAGLIAVNPFIETFQLAALGASLTGTAIELGLAVVDYTNASASVDAVHLEQGDVREETIYSEKMTLAIIKITKCVLKVIASLIALGAVLTGIQALYATAALIASTVGVSLSIVEHFYKDSSLEERMRAQLGLRDRSLSVRNLLGHFDSSPAA